MKNMLENTIITFMIVLGLLFLIIMSSRVYSDWQDNKAEQETIYCTVKDKDQDFFLAGRVPINKYNLTVSPEGNNKYEEIISVSAGLYDEVEVGDSIKCQIGYSDDGIKWIEIAE